MIIIDPINLRAQQQVPDGEVPEQKLLEDRWLRRMEIHATTSPTASRLPPRRRNSSKTASSVDRADPQRGDITIDDPLLRLPG
ncbi:TPA: hypothetical protein ACSRGI_005540 [Klebsiella variicola subsp. variicola]|uniref:hypothetical protein n=1 Tax=Klebsiella variicola TaxID=244366 RepID=UPI003FA57FD1